jgi:sn-glycerol 3-phosphate transport system permease protein
MPRSRDSSRRSQVPAAAARGRRPAFTPLPYLLILPTLLFVTLFTIWPTISSAVGSFYVQRLNMAKYRNPVFGGLANYQALFEDPTFAKVVANTALYVLASVPSAVVLGFLFALLINRPGRGIGFARLALFHPAVLPMVSVATIWMFLLTPGYGLFNATLSLLGVHGPQNWSGNPDLALPAIVLVALFKNSGYYMIFYLAGMQGLPREIYEAARLDGAGAAATTLWITLPLLRRTTLFVTTIAFIGAFQTVDHVFVLTAGGPSNASNVLLYYLWQTRFDSLDVGQASALTIFLIAVLLMFTVSNFLLSERGGGSRGEG